MTQQKLFPLRLPKDYHGKPKPFRKLSQINKERSIHRENPEYSQMKIGDWQLKRLDKDVIQERRNFVVHPAKVSSDTPYWFKSTYHHFVRSNYQQQRSQMIKQNSQDMPFAKSFHSQFEFTANRSFLKEPREVTQKVGRTTGTRWLSRPKEVSPKVGAVEERDYSIRKPMLKIGQTHPHNFVNTYSIS